MFIPQISLKEQYKSLKTEVDKEVLQVLENGNYILGENVKKCEEEISVYVGAKFGIGVNSGTDAIVIALKGLGIGLGDEVITSTFSFFATVEAICLVGAKPVFVDINPKTYNIDVSQIEKCVTSKTKAIIPVHLYGQPADMNEILSISKKYNIKVIEDAAQAIGAKYKDKSICSVGDAGCLSFFPTKNLGACGDAGMITTSDENLAQQFRVLRDHGSVQKYKHSYIGTNSRLDEIQAAILRVKLKYLDIWTKKRQENAQIYNDLLKDIVVIPYVASDRIHVYNQYTIRIDGASDNFKQTRNDLHDYLKAQGISAAVHYPIPLHLQDALKFLGYKKGDLPISEKVADEVLSLPVYPELTREQMKFICDTVKSFFEVQPNIKMSALL